MKRTYTAQIEIESTRTEYVRRWVQAESLEEAEQELLRGNFEETIDDEECTDSSERIVGCITETEDR